MNIIFYNKKSHSIIENIRRPNTLFSIGKNKNEFFLSCEISCDEIFEFYIEPVSKTGVVETCPVCFELFIPDKETICGHATCNGCIQKMFRYNLTDCPLCRHSLIK